MMTHPNVPADLLAAIRRAGDIEATEGSPITAGLLADWLAQLPRDLPVVTAAYCGGDETASPAADAKVLMYRADSGYSGTPYGRADVVAQNPDAEECDMPPADAVLAVHIGPTN